MWGGGPHACLASSWPRGVRGPPAAYTNGPGLCDGAEAAQRVVERHSAGVALVRFRPQGGGRRVVIAPLHVQRGRPMSPAPSSMSPTLRSTPAPAGPPGPKGAARRRGTIAALLGPWPASRRPRHCRPGSGRRGGSELGRAPGPLARPRPRRVTPLCSAGSTKASGEAVRLSRGAPGRFMCGLWACTRRTQGGGPRGRRDDGGGPPVRCVAAAGATPNRAQRVEDDWRVLMLNPSAPPFGALFGLCFRTGEKLPLCAPPATD